MKKTLFFCHIPKTGGQTCLRAFLKPPFTKNNRVYVRNSRESHDVPHALYPELNEEYLCNKIAVYGHLSMIDFLSNPFYRQQYTNSLVEVVTIVREPISRLCSLYNYLRANKAHPNHEKATKEGMNWFSKHRPTSQVKILSSQNNLQLDSLKASEYDAIISEIFSSIKVLPIEGSEHAFPRTINAFLGQAGLDQIMIEASGLTKQNSTTEKWKVTSDNLVTPDILKAHSEPVYSKLKIHYMLDTLLHELARG